MFQLCETDQGVDFFKPHSTLNHLIAITFYHTPPNNHHCLNQHTRELQEGLPSYKDVQKEVVTGCCVSCEELLCGCCSMDHRGKRHEVVMVEGLRREVGELFGWMLGSKTHHEILQKVKYDRLKNLQSAETNRINFQKKEKKLENEINDKTTNNDNDNLKGTGDGETKNEKITEKKNTAEFDPHLISVSRSNDVVLLMDERGRVKGYTEHGVCKFNIRLNEGWRDCLQNENNDKQLCCLEFKVKSFCVGYEGTLVVGVRLMCGEENGVVAMVHGRSGKVEGILKLKEVQKGCCCCFKGTVSPHCPPEGSSVAALDSGTFIVADSVKNCVSMFNSSFKHVSSYKNFESPYRVVERWRDRQVLVLDLWGAKVGCL